MAGNVSADWVTGSVWDKPTYSSRRCPSGGHSRLDVMNNRTELWATIGLTLDSKNTNEYVALERLVDIVQHGQSGGNAVTAQHVTHSFNALSQRTQIARSQSTGWTMKGDG